MDGRMDVTVLSGANAPCIQILGISAKLALLIGWTVLKVIVRAVVMVWFAISPSEL